MTVKNLREKLKDLDDNLQISLEGCDCYTEWNGKVEVNEHCIMGVKKGEYVLLRSSSL